MSIARATVAVVGATGAVGREAVALLAQRGHDQGRVRALASSRSEGQVLSYRGLDLPVGQLSHESLMGCDVALFCSTAGVAREFVPPALERGTRVVDCSSAFRADESVPLVVPEVNGDLLARPTSLVANPNCSTILLVLVLEPLRRAFGLRDVLVSTYQAASGAGLEAVEELRNQTRAVLDGRVAEPRAFPLPCAFNVFPHESATDVETGLNVEEQKISSESGRIWGEDAPPVLATCARVPVERVHAQSVTCELERDASVEEARAALAAAPGVELVDDRAAGAFPTSLGAAHRDEVLVGRVRVDAARPRRLALWLCGDQLRKGAALNALQALERAH